MKTAILQHELSTPPGSTLEWLNKANFKFQVYKLFESSELPDLSEFDLLIICGGSMNVDQEDQFSWLKPEKALIKSAILNLKKVVGLCLGSQLIAECLGGKAYRHKHSEVGWHTVNLLKSSELSFDQSQIKVFQYHSYTFDLPQKAQLFATNSICQNQAYTYQNNVLAFQFHPETTLDWALECANDIELTQGPYCQTAQEIILENKNQVQLQSWYFETLNQFIKK